MTLATIVQALPGMEVETADEFGYWLSGLADGEGSFNILVNRSGPFCCFHIALRDDDRAVLEEIQVTLGFGRLHADPAREDFARKNKPSCRWVVAANRDCLKLVDLFTNFPLRTKKKRDFDIWADAVQYMYTNTARHSRWRSDPAKAVRTNTLLTLKAELQSQRRYT